ncbi:MAG: D-alanine--D-alanine ligase [Firmicutes bacterium]|nr:D-alanine--D-alanine ligase [Bacillota bacterium]
MHKKTRVGILFGGKSAEHEVSLQSAKSIIEAIDKEKYEVALIGIDKQGRWYSPGKDLNQPSRFLSYGSLEAIDVVFPVLHGPFGEDGTVQGLLKLADIPFVGAGVLGSAVGMDKDVMKRLLRDAGLPTAKFLVFNRSLKNKINFDKVVKELGLPLFVKPANLGSSVGINKVKSKDDFDYSVADAFKYDNKILIEEFIKAREIECSVLGNEDPIASLPGEIIPQHEFYAYETKYIDDEGAILKIPAELPDDTVKNIQELAIKTFKTLCCEGMGRVDFFLADSGEILVNEINTIPGFTKISMYPKLWEASGISYKELIDRLIQLAIERHKRECELQTSLS